MSPQRQTAIQFGSWVVSHRLGVIRVVRVMDDLRADPMDMLVTGAHGLFSLDRQGWECAVDSGKPLGRAYAW